jgi:predicted nucleic acid-binding protein
VTTFVVDASVAAKWVVPETTEPLADRADRFLRAYAMGSVHILVPDLFWLEIGNFLWKAARRGEIQPDRARSALEAMLQRGFPTIATRSIMPEALKIALEFDRTVYDSAYVALAVATHSNLITADERLVNTLAARFPVRWLGAFHE